MRLVGVYFTLIVFSSADEGNKENGNLDPIEAFKVQYLSLFKGIRKQHFDAIKRIIKMDDKGKINEMLRTVIEKSFEPLSKAKSSIDYLGNAKQIIEKAITDENIRNCNDSCSLANIIYIFNHFIWF